MFRVVLNNFWMYVNMASQEGFIKSLTPRSEIAKPALFSRTASLFFIGVIVQSALGLCVTPPVALMGSLAENCNNIWGALKALFFLLDVSLGRKLCSWVILLKAAHFTLSWLILWTDEFQSRFYSSRTQLYRI